MMEPETDQSSAYTLLEKLGMGSFGTVWKAVHNETGQVVAIKIINLETTTDDLDEIQAEIAHLRTCLSDKVTRYYGSFIKGYRLWIVMEYLAGGSCQDLVSPPCWGCLADAPAPARCLHRATDRHRLPRAVTGPRLPPLAGQDPP
jgi:hypothetical protein